MMMNVHESPPTLPDGHPRSESVASQKEGKEYMTLQSCHSELVGAITYSNCCVAIKLFSKSLISKETERKMRMNCYSDEEKAGFLLDNVCAKVQSNSTRYYDFIDVLKEEGLFEDIREKIESTMASLSRTAGNNQHPVDSGSSSPEAMCDTVFINQSTSSRAVMESSAEVRAMECTESRAMETEVTPQTDHGEDGPCDVNAVFNYIKSVKHLRCFGLQLGIDPGKLNQIEREHGNVDVLLLIIIEWFKKEIDESERWKELYRVLQLPSVCEPRRANELRTARDLRPPLISGSSVDSAISMISNSPRSSLSSSTSIYPYYYQISYIENEIGRRTDKCSIQNALNVVALYHDWFEIGVNLQLPLNELEPIRGKNCSCQDQKAHMVELWERTDLNGLSWTKLSEALKLLVKTKQPRTGSTTSADFCIPQSSNTYTSIPEEPVIDISCLESQLSPEEEKVRESTEALKEEFQNLQIKVMETLESKDVKFKGLARTIKTFPGRVNLHIFKNLKKISGEEYDCDDIFQILNEKIVWTFLDFSLLEHIIRKHAVGLSAHMKEYSKKVENFRKRTTVFQLVRVWDRIDEPAEYHECQKLIARYNKDPDNCTLEDLEVIRRRSCLLLKNTPLSQAALVLFRLKPGSITIIWIVRTELVQQFKEAFAQCIREGTYFKENNIISTELDGEIFMSMERKLLKTSREGNDREVDKLLKIWNREKHAIDETDEEGKTALILSSELGHNGVVVSLLEANININYQTEDKKWSALFYAYEGGHHGTVKLLIEYGADETLKDKEGKEAAAYKQDHEEIENKVAPSIRNLMKKQLKKLSTIPSNLMKKLRAKKKKLDMDLLHHCKNGNFEAAKELLEGGGIDIETKDFNFRDWTPLMWACENGHFKIVELLIQHYANVMGRAENGWTPLHIACSNNFVRIANLLLRHGADCNAVINPKTTYTPLMWTSDLNFVEIARTLLKHGADVEMGAARNGWTPLIQATFHRCKDLVKLYLEYGANPNKQAKKGWTALMEAARKNEGEIAEMLIEHGARTGMVMKDAKKYTGEPALHIASFMGSPDVVRVLNKRGADVNVTNRVGLTALMIATNHKNVEVVDALLENKNIDVNIPHRVTGLPAIFLAAKNGQVDIFERLLQYGAHTEVGPISVSEVAQLFKRKAITTRLKKFRMVDQPQAEREVESEAQAEIQGEQTLMKECGEEKQVEVHAEVQVSEVETEKQAQVQTGQLEDEQAEHAVAESLQLELTTVQVEPEVPDHSEPICKEEPLDSSGAVDESDQTEKLNVEAVEQEQAPPVSVPLKDTSESESDKPDAPEKEEPPQIIEPRASESGDTSSLYDAEEVVTVSVKRVDETQEKKQDTTTKVSSNKQAKDPKKIPDLRNMSLKERMSLYEKILKDYSIRVNNSDVDSSDFNEDSGKGVKPVETRIQKQLIS